MIHVMHGGRYHAAIEGGRERAPQLDCIGAQLGTSAWLVLAPHEARLAGAASRGKATSTGSVADAIERSGPLEQAAAMFDWLANHPGPGASRSRRRAREHGSAVCASAPVMSRELAHARSR
jgi:hypothetical protein